MDQIVRQFIAHSLAPSTKASYRSAANRYLVFCHQFNFPPLPLSQEKVTRFVAHLATTGVAYQSIRVYLSAIRFLQISSGLPDPSLGQDPILGYMLRGVHRLPPSTRRMQRLPITADVMRLLFDTWSRVPESEHYDAAMLWAACCMGFFGFMRAGEFTCQSWQAFSPTMLTPQDIYIDSHNNPTIVTVHLRRSKTDPFGAGVSIHLGRSGCAVCPVAAILGYIARRGLHHGPFFLFRDGSPLSRQKLMGHVKQALTQHGIDSTGFTGHSFRIGAATSAALAGLEDSFIQSLGRWRSSTFQRYIRTPVRALASSAHRLMHP